MQGIFCNLQIKKNFEYTNYALWFASVHVAQACYAHNLYA